MYIKKETARKNAKARRKRPPHAALQLPEILMLVLAQLQDHPAALYAAMRVNRAWFHAAARRRQFYANMVVALDVAADGGSRGGSSGYERIELPALRQLNVQLAARTHSAVYTVALPFVGPRLEELTGRLSDALLARLQRCRPCTLRWLRLADELYDGGSSADDGPVSRVVGSGRFAGWLLADLQPRLDGVTLFGRMFASQKQFDAVFCVWAQHAPLRQLRLLVWPHWFTAATLAAVQQMRAAPVPLFARLTELQLPVHARAVSGLVDLLTSSPLTEMTMYVEPGDDGYYDSDHNEDNGADMSNKYAVLPAVARLTTLRTLAVYLFYTKHVVSTNDLLALRSLTQLRYLSLSCGPAPAVTHVHMRQLLGSLPLLQTLCCRLVL